MSGATHGAGDNFSGTRTSGLGAQGGEFDGTNRGVGRDAGLMNENGLEHPAQHHSSDPYSKAS